MLTIFRSVLVITCLVFASSVIAQNDELITYGLKKGMIYNQARLILLKGGWKPKLDEDAGKISKEFPEISCGEGMTAVCSVGFKKGKESVAFVLKSVGKMKFIVDGTY